MTKSKDAIEEFVKILKSVEDDDFMNNMVVDKPQNDWKPNSKIIDDGKLDKLDIELVNAIVDPTTIKINKGITSTKFDNNDIPQELSKNDFNKLPIIYIELCDMYMPRVIKNDIQYNKMCDMAFLFCGYEELMNQDQNDYLETISILICDYQNLNMGDEPISAATLNMITSSIKNINDGVPSIPLDLEKLKSINLEPRILTFTGDEEIRN